MDGRNRGGGEYRKIIQFTKFDGKVIFSIKNRDILSIFSNSFFFSVSQTIDITMDRHVSI